MPAPSGPSVQIFGRKDSRPTQKALRFFKERRVGIMLVDIAVKPPALTELRRFCDRLGVREVVDIESTAYRDAGLGYLRMEDADLFGRLLADPRLLKLPLVRFGNQFTAGVAEATWKTWRPA